MRQGSKITIAQHEHMSHFNDNQRPRVGLALSGGAARGIAHIGVLRAFAENHIPIAAITGASAGALVGGFYAAGMSIPELEEMARKVPAPR